MRSNEVKKCLDLCYGEFEKNFVNTNYEQTLKLSEAILNLTKALSHQVQLEKINKNESEENN